MLQYFHKLDFFKPLQAVLSIAQISVTISRCITSNQNNIRLLKLIIPIFPGKLSDWTYFKNMIVSIVHWKISLHNI